MRAKMYLCNFMCCFMVIVTVYSLTMAVFNPEYQFPGLYVGSLSLIASIAYHFIGKNA